MTLFKAVEMPSVVPVNYVGVHPVRWHEHPDQPTAGFAPVDVENLALNIAVEAITELNQRGGYDDLWSNFDPELRAEITFDLKNSILKILEGITI